MSLVSSILFWGSRLMATKFPFNAIGLGLRGVVGKGWYLIESGEDLTIGFGQPIDTRRLNENQMNWLEAEIITDLSALVRHPSEPFLAHLLRHLTSIKQWFDVKRQLLWLHSIRRLLNDWIEKSLLDLRYLVDSMHWFRRYPGKWCLPSGHAMTCLWEQLQVWPFCAINQLESISKRVPQDDTRIYL